MGVPEPQPAPALTAEELVARIRLKGGRVHRMIDAPQVFVLTTDELLAGWLESKGARGAKVYDRTRKGPKEWDIWINTIPVSGEQTIWEASA